MPLAVLLLLALSTIESPLYIDEMPEDWAARSAGDVVTIAGAPARAVVVDYNGKDSSNRTAAFHQIAAIVEHDKHLVVLSDADPSTLHDKYAGAFQMVGSTLRASR